MVETQYGSTRRTSLSCLHIGCHNVVLTGCLADDGIAGEFLLTDAYISLRLQGDRGIAQKPQRIGRPVLRSGRLPGTVRLLRHLQVLELGSGIS